MMYRRRTDEMNGGFWWPVHGWKVHHFSISFPAESFHRAFSHHLWLEGICIWHGCDYGVFDGEWHSDGDKPLFLYLAVASTMYQWGVHLLRCPVISRTWWRQNIWSIAWATWRNPAWHRAVHMPATMANRPARTGAAGAIFGIQVSSHFGRKRHSFHVERHGPCPVCDIQIAYSGPWIVSDSYNLFPRFQRDLFWSFLSSLWLQVFDPWEPSV